MGRCWVKSTWLCKVANANYYTSTGLCFDIRLSVKVGTHLFPYSWCRLIFISLILWLNNESSNSYVSSIMYNVCTRDPDWPVQASIWSDTGRNRKPGWLSAQMLTDVWLRGSGLPLLKQILRTAPVQFRVSHTPRTYTLLYTLQIRHMS